MLGCVLHYDSWDKFNRQRRPCFSENSRDDGYGRATVCKRDDEGYRCAVFRVELKRHLCYNSQCAFTSDYELHQVVTDIVLVNLPAKVQNLSGRENELNPRT